MAEREWQVTVEARSCPYSEKVRNGYLSCLFKTVSSFSSCSACLFGFLARRCRMLISFHWMAGIFSCGSNWRSDQFGSPSVKLIDNQLRVGFSANKLCLLPPQCLCPILGVMHLVE